MALQNGDSANDNGTHSKPRILIIGAGSRGNAYARAVTESGLAIVAAVADPIKYKRRRLGSKYIWTQHGEPQTAQEFESWQDFSKWETQRRLSKTPESQPSITAAFVCVLDEQHVEVVTGLAPLKLHIMCEKPLATSLSDCIAMYSSMISKTPEEQETIFGIGHVLRYSPHNMLLRKMVLEEGIIGEVLSVEHTEPVGWWHFSHSYVRQLAKRVLDSAVSTDQVLPRYGLASVDDLLSSIKVKPETTLAIFSVLDWISEAVSSIAEANRSSAPKIYYDKHLAKGITDWPVNIVNPEIESCNETSGASAAKDMLISTLAEDYNDETSHKERYGRPWYGRCVWEADNDVCDDQFVTITWQDDQDSTKPADENKHRGAKTATFHMIAQTEMQCERRGYIYGTQGEISYDGTTIRVYDHATGSVKLFHPPRAGGGHGGGDDGLAQQFLKAIIAVQEKTMTPQEAQIEYLGCTLEEILRSHALVFASEEARLERKVVDWLEWWEARVESALLPTQTM